VGSHVAGASASGVVTTPDGFLGRLTEHIIAEIDGARLLILGAAPDVTHGVQEALPELYTELIRLTD
jgi:hypothetical protein